MDASELDKIIEKSKAYGLTDVQKPPAMSRAEDYKSILSDKASFVGGLKDFYDFIGPKIKNDIATITKKRKIELNNMCQKCNQKKELDAAHKQGNSRKDIIKRIIDNYITQNGKYYIPDLRKTINDIIASHKPIEDNLLFLCKECHTKYDDAYDVGMQKEQSDEEKTEYAHPTTDTYVSGITDADYEKEFIRLISVNRNLKQCLKELFMKFPDTEIKSTDLRKTWEKYHPDGNNQKVTDYLWNLEKEGVLEKTDRSFYKLASKSKSIDDLNVSNLHNVKTQTDLNNSSKIDDLAFLHTNDQNILSKEHLCENESLSWKYKIGWASIANRKNIEEIISKIEQNFECKGEPHKSWYYFNRNNNNRQFAGILCHKHRSEIAFRFDHVTFGINDQRIIKDKSWFFQQNEEGRIAIIPENYDLILRCLHHAYDITGRMSYKN